MLSSWCFHFTDESDFAKPELEKPVYESWSDQVFGLPVLNLSPKFDPIKLGFEFIPFIISYSNLKT